MHIAILVCGWQKFVVTSVDETWPSGHSFFYYVIHFQLEQQSVHVYNHWNVVVTGEWHLKT